MMRRRKNDISDFTKLKQLSNSNNKRTKNYAK